MTTDGATKLLILNADNPNASPQLISLGKVLLADVNWAGNNRLVLTVINFTRLFDLVIPVSRSLVVDLPGGASRILDPKGRGLVVGRLLFADPSGNWALIASQSDLFSSPAVRRVDLATGEAILVEKPRPHVWDWYVDETGLVRAGIAFDARKWTMWYRDRPGEPLKPLKGKFDKAGGAVDRITFGNRQGEGTIITNEKTGRFAVYKYDYRTATIGAPIYEHPKVDISDIMLDPATGSVRGVRYQDDRRHTAWLDPKLAATQAKLDKALPGAVNDIVDLSRDGNRLLVWSGGASDPGTYYLLDRTTLAMHPLVQPLERIDPAKLATVRSVSYAARDGLAIPAYLTLPPGREARGLPLIVMPHGGPFARDDWEYDAQVQFLANRGYAVLQPQFRGSTGYGEDFVARGYGEWGRKMQDDLDDGVDWLVKSGQVDPRRVCIVGGSYGGYAALWGAVRNPERYRCAASLAGVSDLSAQLRANRKSMAATRYFREWRAKVAGKGDVDLASVSPIRFVGRIHTPLFIAHGEDDDRVSAKQSHAMVSALNAAHADVTSVFYKDMGHGFSDSKSLADYLSRLEAFLTKNNPP